MTELDLLYIKPRGDGWAPIHALAALTTRLLGARRVTVDDRGNVSYASKAGAYLPRRRGGARSLLLLAPNPAHLAYATHMNPWLRRYDSIAAWVIDSFSTEWIGRFAQRRQFDQIFITDRNLIDEWHDRTASAIHWAPWGSDTLARPIGSTARTSDVLRLGRQPAAWSDDMLTARACEEEGIRFATVPRMTGDGVADYANVRQSLGSTRFVLAFSNLVSPGNYTHSTRDYVTARWVDGLASGAVVAGRAPVIAGEMFWDGATLEIDPWDRAAGVRALAEAVNSWTPAVAERNAALARERLDWRLRLRDIVTTCGWDVPGTLTEELGRLGGAMRHG
ncbi:MAG: hypothetical protein JSS74_03455 [Actinobacteria bacterium]|nr:hypothetical protein [Actinomycetota bacterium]